MTDNTETQIIFDDFDRGLITERQRDEAVNAIARRASQSAAFIRTRNRVTEIVDADAA